MPAPFPGLRHGAELSVCARASGRGARSLTGWGSDRVLGVGPCAPARSGSEAGLGWVTSSGGSVGCGDFEDPGVIHGDVPAAPVDEVVVLGAQEHERSEEHTSELQSLMRISYAVFCLTKTQTP